jgi:hypothetical protein
MRAKIVIFLIIISTSVCAEIEKVAIPGEDGFKFYWWPKLVPFKEWHHDRDASLHYQMNAMVPDGSTFGEAETVIYGKAIYKAREPELTSLDMLIERDRDDFLVNIPDISINESEPILISDGTKLQSFTFFPQSKGNWEKVAYCDDGDYYLVFTISSRSEKGYKSAKQAYEKMVESYTSEP